MADERTFPTFSASNWWKLREKFHTSLPRTVTDDYLGSVLNMQPQSVKANGLIANLKMLGLIDEEGKCTDLANRWRMDDSYQAVCKEMRDKIYPSELIDIGEDRSAINTWFMRKSGGGHSLASKLVSFYLLIAFPEIKRPSEKKPLSKPKRIPTPQKDEQDSKPRENEALSKAQDIPSNNSLPSVNLNLQIHISAEASTEQIDQIFASMAKHVYGRE